MNGTNMDPREVEMMDEVVSGGFTLRELHAAFDRVADQMNWKNPIRATVVVSEQCELDAIREAVGFFAGSTPKFELVAATYWGRGRWLVTAPGYYASVGA